ncbi:MAG: Gfo/Idh/MocA family oxidoreductase [Anaerolineae bacterium]
MPVARVVRVGVLGCGAVAQSVHLPALRRLPGVQVVALADPDADRLRQAARLAPAARTFADYQDALAERDLDAVVICLPNELHARAGQAALEAGKHVYLEKPLATDLAEGEALLRIWRASGLIGMVGFNYRHNPLYQALRRALRSGEIGVPVAMQTVFTASRIGMPAWQCHRGTGAGVLLDLGSHHIDLIRYLTGREVAEATAVLRTVRYPGDTAVLTLQLEDGVPVQSLFSWSTMEQDRIEVWGIGGKLAVDRYRSLSVERGARPGPLGRLSSLHPLQSLGGAAYLVNKLGSVAGEPSYRAALRTFVAAVASGGEPTPTLEDGWHSLEVVLAARAHSLDMQPLQAGDTPALALSTQEATVGKAKAGPALSVVVITPGDLTTIAGTLSCLAAQTVREQMEVIVVAPEGISQRLEAWAHAGWHSLRVVPVGKLEAVGQANRAGLMASSAPVVALVENHAYPDSRWAEALLKTHADGWAAVGPMIDNANPTSAVSWAAYLAGYGRWLGAQAGPIDDIPGHNSSYKRDLLLALDGDLERTLETESVLHRLLLDRGHALYLQPEAKSAHVNPSRLASALAEVCLYGRLYAANRARAGSVWRRLACIAAVPLIPWLRLRRLLPAVRHVRAQRQVPRRTMLALLLVLVASACGEFMGYTLGAGGAAAVLGRFELKRHEHLSASDCQRFVARCGDCDGAE